jgi:micrococcal nuclease
MAFWHGLGAALVIAAAALSACGPSVDLTVQAPATFPEEPGGYEAATIERVVDGDTLVVRITGRTDGPGLGDSVVGRSYRVRLIGIDTPESVDPRRPVECFGHEAGAAMSALVKDRSVRLVKDVEETDRYDRLLRYVYMEAEMANARLVTNGYAHAYTFPPNVRHSDLFVRLEREARENDRGLWAPDTCNAMTRSGFFGLSDN